MQADIKKRRMEKTPTEKYAMWVKDFSTPARPLLCHNIFQRAKDFIAERKTGPLARASFPIV
jgi:hypothetical protein